MALSGAARSESFTRTKVSLWDLALVEAIRDYGLELHLDLLLSGRTQYDIWLMMAASTVGARQLSLSLQAID